MSKNFEILSDQPDAQFDHESFMQDILIGLTSPKKYLSSMYFYNAKGDRLFQQITDADEYYLTNCEAEIFTQYGDKILGHCHDGFVNFIELGAGDGRKTKILLEKLRGREENFRYVPVDISKNAVQGLCNAVSTQFPDMETHGLVSEYFDGIRWIGRSNKGQNFVLFLGSNLGNFSQQAAHEFLTRLWLSLNNNDLLLIGLDLRKDTDLLMAAYSDAAGHTREFNLNLLDRINAELGANFDRNAFAHDPFYNDEINAMESRIVSLKDQVVDLPAMKRNIHFRKNESIHTEYSHKYTPTQIQDIAKNSGFEVIDIYHDERKYFSDSVWRVIK